MFQKGHKKYGGREKGKRNRISQELFNKFLDTISEVEQDEEISKGKTFFRKVVEWGFIDKQVGIAILKKLVPDKLYNEMDFQPEENVKVNFEIINKKYDEKSKRYRDYDEEKGEFIKEK